VLLADALQRPPLGPGRLLAPADEERAQRQQVPPPEPPRAPIVQPEPVEDRRPVPAPEATLVPELVEVTELPLRNVTRQHG